MTHLRLLALKASSLLTHPRNMRRFYPQEHVREMANSIVAAKGVIEPLIVMREQSGNKWLVIDGNMRLAAARLLGDNCPLLDCKVVECAEAEQLLTMVAANQVRYDIDPVSEGLHYKALMAEGLSARDISKRTGVYEIRIGNRKILADLDEPIQKLIAADKFTSDSRVARALLQLKPGVRIKLATRLAENPNTKIATVLKACERLAMNKKPAARLKRPAVELSGANPADEGNISSKNIRAAAKTMCGSCNQFEDRLQKEGEPAWAMVVHAADKNCENCDLKSMQIICSSCPAVTFLQRLIDLKEKSHGK